MTSSLMGLFASADGPVISYRIQSQYRARADANKCGPVSLCENHCVSTLFGNCVKWERICNYRTYNFDDLDKLILREALEKISDIIRDSNVRRYAWTKSPSVTSMVFCGASVSESWNDFEDLQWTARWPTVNILPYVDNTNFQGRACVENLELVGNKWNREATIEINIEYLTYQWNRLSGSNSRKVHILSDEVAGVILHEVLHQMGHAHDCTYKGEALDPYGVQDGLAFFISRIGQGLTEALKQNSDVRRLAERFSPKRGEFDDSLYYGEHLIGEGESETLEEDELLWGRHPRNTSAFNSSLHLAPWDQKEEDPTLEDTYYHNHSLIDDLIDIPSPTRHTGIDGDSVSADPIFNGTSIRAENPDCDDNVCQCRCVRIQVYDEYNKLIGERVELYSIGAGDHGEVVEDTFDDSGSTQAYSGFFLPMMSAILAFIMFFL